MASPPRNRQQRREAARRGNAAPAADPRLGQALALQQQGRLPEARRLFEQVLAERPDHADALHFLGVLTAQAGDAAGGARLIERALGLSPGRPMYLCNLGKIYRALGRTDEAIALYRQAIAVDAAFAPAWNFLGIALDERGEADEAIAAFERAIAIAPKFPGAHLNLGVALKHRGRAAEAAEAYRRALALNPRSAEAWSNLGAALKQLGDFAGAIAAHERALALRPDLVRSRWGALLTVPMICESEDEIEKWRARFAAGLDELDKTLALDRPEQVADAVSALMSGTNFNLHGQGRPDRELQERFGRLQQRVAAAAYPELSRPLEKRIPGAGERPRVGFVSAFFYGHSVYKIHGRWITQLDRSRFESHVFHLGRIVDEATEDLRAHADHFHSGFADERAAIKAIRDAALDVLIYTDIGMEPQVQLLAALRLAPVQCNAGCHPITSGLATIDYFLTSDLMEPPGGERHYSETVVRLPNLLASYPWPPVERAATPPSLGGDDPAGRVTFLNLQSLWKLLPRHDELYPRIARAAPQSRFWFIAGRAPEVNAMFRRRLERAFAAHGLDAGAWCTLHPHLTQLEFFGLVRRADVILDSMVWSGNNTSMEATACDKPIVTLPGPFMRSRHSAAILEFLGVTDTIARDVDDYVAIAARLAHDPAGRARLAERIRAAKGRIFCDDAPVRALEDFMLGLFARA